MKSSDLFESSKPRLGCVAVCSSFDVVTSSGVLESVGIEAIFRRSGDEVVFKVPPKK